MRGLILDGVIASGKTTLLRRLQQRIATQTPPFSQISLTELYTERMIEHLRVDGILPGRSVRDHIEAVILSLETFERMLKASRFSEDPGPAQMLVTLDRLILTFQASEEIQDQGYSLDLIEGHFRRLASLGIQQVVLWIPPDQMKDRILLTLEYRNECWRDYLFSRGGVEEIVAHYLRWQENCLRWAEKASSFIPTRILETDGTVEGFEGVCNEVLEILIGC